MRARPGYYSDYKFATSADLLVDGGLVSPANF
jgi:hypothetical protein